ncbi:Aste57867_17641 [Aphanomyces stellatus]|uniref:Aste57867_17641 protein n=2 Tax=Aphanomyces stellatus TaxID=120398 RepID=A0A485L8E4_9STRA|nr:hypothetical protein As57867_017581 [Aphanomyces stellatus]VFT94392.1 Aste57867_17641 [Aphanomyces stellatus]
MVRLAVITAALAASAMAGFNNHKTITDLINQVSKTEDAVTAPVDMWVDQPLDHTDAANKKTWKQRYHFNNAWFKGAGSPVFVYINGENVADPASTTSPSYFMNELAQKYGALVVSVEHRFYGKSQPTGDLTNESLKYLTMGQALADLANFQDYFVGQQNLTKANKWVTFGGSYPGMLSGFAKSKYPERFAGSIASSAPINTKVDFYEYADVVASALKYYGGDACVDTVAAGAKAVHDLLASTKAEDAATFTKLFNPCAPIKNDADRMTVESLVFGNFQGIVQYNGLQEETVAGTCKFFADVANGATPLDKIALFTRNHWDARKCTGSDYDTENITPFLDTKPSDNIMRQWIYQTCAEFGFAQSTATAKSFWKVFSYNTVDRAYTELCKRVYAITNTEERTAATRQTYGALKINVENVAWPNGNIDPWHALSFDNTTVPVNTNSDHIFIDGTAHCADMYNRKYNLAPQWAMNRVEANVVKFLADKPAC